MAEAEAEIAREQAFALNSNLPIDGLEPPAPLRPWRDGTPALPHALPEGCSSYELVCLQWVQMALEWGTLGGRRMRRHRGRSGMFCLACPAFSQK